MTSKTYWKNHYKSSKYGKTNTYEIFIEKGLSILKNNRPLGFIIPIVILNVSACKGIRELLINEYKIDEISYTEFNVFENANVDTMVLIVENSKDKQSIRVQKFAEFFETIIEKINIEHKEILADDEYKISIKQNDINKSIFKKVPITFISTELDFYNGIATGPDKEKYFSQEKINDKYKPLIMGNNIGQYIINYDGRYINYDRELLHRAREEKIFLANEKIVMQRIRNLKLDKRLVSTIDESKFYTFNSVNNLLLKIDSKYNLKYFLGLLNSKLLNYLFKQKSLNTNITLSDLDLLPIRSIDFKNKSEVHTHDQIVSSVDQLLQLNKDLQAETLESKREQIKRKIDHFEDKINELVYKLYDLTEEEIGIIEG